MKEETSNRSISGPYHSKASTHTPNIKDLIYEQEGEVSRKNLRTEGQGEIEGEHRTLEVEKHLLIYKYLDIGNAVKQPTLMVSEALITPTGPSQTQHEERLLQEGLEEFIMGDDNDNNAKKDTTTTTFEFPIKNIEV